MICQGEGGEVGKVGKKIETNKKREYRGTCLAQSVGQLPSVQVMISGSWDGASIELPAQWGICFCLSLCPSRPCLCVCALSLTLK